MRKSELRKLFKEKRSRLSDEELNQKSRSVLEKIFDFVDFAKASYVHIFLPIERLREIDTLPIILRIQREFPEITLCVPRIREKENDMESVVLRDPSVTTINHRGIPEPTEGEIIDSKDIDIVFVPLLCADLNGNRVGYGKGFYDRFLSECRSDCKKIGLSLFDLVESIDDLDNHDIPLDEVIIA